MKSGLTITKMNIVALILLSLLLTACGPSPEPMLAAAPAPANIPSSQADDIIHQLTLANMVIVVPPAANINEKVLVHLLIDTQRDPATDMVTRERLTRARVLISKIVNASLVSSGFDVAPITPTRQAISPSQPTTWVWELTPREEGTHSVHVSLNAIVTVGDDKAERSIRTFDHEVDVTITTTQWVVRFFHNHWEWLFGTILIPIIGVAWARYRR